MAKLSLIKDDDVSSFSIPKKLQMHVRLEKKMKS